MTTRQLSHSLAPGALAIAMAFAQSATSAERHRSPADIAPAPELSLELPPVLPDGEPDDTNHGCALTADASWEPGTYPPTPRPCGAVPVSGWHPLFSTMPIGQEFTPSHPTVAAIDVLLSAQDPSVSDIISLSLRLGDITGPVVATVSRPVLGVMGFARFTFDTPAPVVPGALYVIELSSTIDRIGWWDGHCDGEGGDYADHAMILNGSRADLEEDKYFRIWSCPRCGTQPIPTDGWYRQCVAAGLLPPQGGWPYGTQRPEPSFVTRLVPRVGYWLETGVGINRPCEHGLGRRHEEDACDQAIAAYAALRFNMESGRLGEDCPLDAGTLDCGADTVGSLAEAMVDTIVLGDRSRCEIVRQCADLVMAPSGLGIP